MSNIQRAYKTELSLNNKQVTACKRHAGAARWAYNWGLARKQESYRATGKSPTAIELHRQLNTLKQTDVPWMYAVSKCAPQEALRNLDNAFAHFFRRVTLKQQGKLRGKIGYPMRKTRKRGLGGFRLTGSIAVFPDSIQLPRLGRLRLKERGYLPTNAKVLSATLSEQAGHWYVSVLVEREHVVPVNSGPVVGVDLGVKLLATLSDGALEPNPHYLKHCLKTIRRLQRAVACKCKGSHNRRKAVRKLATLHRRVAQQRANTLHQLTSRLAKTKSVVVIEDRNVSGMLKQHHLAQAIGDVGWGEFRRQLTYKAAWYGSRVVVVSRWEPSSKTCSACGWADDELTLANRTFCCEQCGQILDRDLNAAINLSKLADSSSESQNACGEASAGLGLAIQVELAPMKQEPDTFYASA
ncbi:MAG TPA: RNA-guided endonuclease TnpB family protein [Ktedonobacterales bacterium]|nr:RNA-guided endonuclease TnpB family protein [Ktedonobacterales bacterium]